MTPTHKSPRAQLPSRQGRRRSPEVDDEDRAVVLAVAQRLLEREGAAALSVRRLAREVGTSYQLVYTLFGGKQGLLDALFRSGFRSLEAACRERPAGDAPVEEVADLALVYRDFARANPELYALMFGRDNPGFEPDAESRRVALESFAVVSEAAARVFEISSGARRHFSDPESLARAAWSATHGHVVLELASWFGPDESGATRLAQTVRALAGGEPPARSD